MQILIVPAVAVRAGGLVYPGEIRVVGYKEHAQEVSRLGALLECAQGDLNQAMKIINTYDEAKERDLFEASFKAANGYAPLLNWDGSYEHGHSRGSWDGWVMCAKSRAGIQS